MKKLVMLIMVLVIISQSLIGQQVDKNSITYKGGISLSERIQSFYHHLMMKHNGTESAWRNKKERSRKLRKEQRPPYVMGEKLKKR